MSEPMNESGGFGRVIGGIELAEKIKKGQFKIGKLGGPTTTMPDLWQAASAA